MKRYFLFIIYIIAVLTGCATTSPQNDSWLGEDKVRHFIVSSAISGSVAAIANNQGMDNKESFYLAFGVTLSFGAGKEAYDKRYGHTGWSWKDLAWDALGALAGYSIVQAVN